NMINQINAELGGGYNSNPYYQQSSYAHNNYQQQAQSSNDNHGLYTNEPLTMSKYYTEEQNIPYYQEQKMYQDSTNQKPATPKTPNPWTPAQGGPSRATQATQYDPPTQDE
ncbi:unnamed protein product, partial [Didymodactylos carnosus]